MSDTNELYKWTSNISPVWKGIIVFSLIGIVGYSGYEIWQGIKNSQTKAAAEAEIDQFNDDLNNLSTSGVSTNFQESQYASWADSIAQAMTGKDLSPSLCMPWGLVSYSGAGASIANIMSNLKNDADFLELQIKFGVRTIDKGWLESNYTNVTLSAAITAQLSTCEIATINDLLKSNGVTKQF